MHRESSEFLWCIQVGWEYCLQLVELIWRFPDNFVELYNGYQVKNYSVNGKQSRGSDSVPSISGELAPRPLKFGQNKEHTHY